MLLGIKVTLIWPWKLRSLNGNYFMKVISETQTTLENLSELPDFLYKYRSWNDKFHKEIISDQVVFMSPPTSFEDLLDCKLQKRYDLITEEEIYIKYLSDSKNNHPHLSRQQHRKLARDLAKNSPIRNREYVKEMQEQHFKEFDERFGVLSLTANPLRLEMWEKYSDFHSGFCVGFDAKEMFKYLGGGGIVQYYEELPIIYPLDSYEIEHFKQVYSKELKWEFEQEYRTHKFYPSKASLSDRKIKLPKTCFKQMIFGSKLSKEDQLEIIGISEHEELNLEFHRQVIDPQGTVSIVSIPK